MPSQSARTKVLLCVVIVGLVRSLGMVPVSAASDRELLERIAVQTHNDKRLEGIQVHVLVQDGQVVLSGTVYLYGQKILYEQIVWQTPGVVEVDNEIRVVPRLPVEDAEIARHIHTIIKGHQRFQNAEITVDVTQGSVSLGGTFHDPGDVLSLKHQVAEIEGVIRLEIMTRFAT
jgi:osmotically-inducible protein OsmY